MVNEGIALNASLNSKASTKDNTSTEKQDGSSSSEHVVDAETARVDKGVSDVENTDVGPSYDKNTLNEECVFNANHNACITNLLKEVILVPRKFPTGGTKFSTADMGKKGKAVKASACWCHAVIVCDEKLVRIPYENETLTFRGNESNNGRESRLTVISCSKAQEYMAKGCQIFLAQISAKKEEDRSEGKQLEDVPVVWDYPKVFPKDLSGLPPARSKEVDELKAERIAKTQDPLALMANSNNPYVFLAPHQDQSSFNQNYLQQSMLNPEDITDPTTAMNMALTLIAKAFKLNYSTPTNNNQRISSNPRNRQITQPGQNARNPAGYNDVIGNQVIPNAVQNSRVLNVGNQNGLIGVQGNGNQNQIGNGNLVVARAEGNTAGQNANQIRCYNCKGVGRYARNCTQASTSGTQTDSAPVYDTDGSAENDNDVISEDTNVEQGGETGEQHPVNFEETRALYESLYQNLAIEVEKVN
nr:putative reverse transcriptase domain-containing protein [Tanacetum cinerariifolium]